MPRGRDSRLGRLTTESLRVDATRGLDASTLSAWQAACRIVRDGLAAAGFDPDCAAALRSHNEGAEEHEPGGMLELRPAEAEFVAGDHDGLASVFATKIEEISRRFRDGHGPDIVSASMAELLAWVLYRRGA